MELETNTSCNPNHVQYSLESIMKAMNKIPELPRRKKLPVYLDGVLKGFLKVRIDCVLNPYGGHLVLECPACFSAWMGKATFGDFVDDI